jgi:hypothetical protein
LSIARAHSPMGVELVSVFRTEANKKALQSLNALTRLAAMAVVK